MILPGFLEREIEGLLQSDIHFQQALCFLFLYFSVFFFYFVQGILELDSKDYKNLIKDIFFLFGIIVDTGVWGKISTCKEELSQL